MSIVDPLARHRVLRLPDDVDTDQLAPGATMKFGLDVVARHCLETVRPGFAAEVRPGDVLVAGRNFGLGSSREQAASVLVHLGVAAVVAPGFSGLYARNAFNVGLLLLACPQAGRLAEGESIAFDAGAGTITAADGTVLACDPIPDFLLAMVRAGGLFNLLRQRLATGNPS
jgi:3-isopropylmalate/(R)-2-methylmalate dehydratase small subunit